MFSPFSSLKFRSVFQYVRKKGAYPGYVLLFENWQKSYHTRRNMCTQPAMVILMKKTTLLILCVAAISVLLIAGCTQTPVPQPTPTATTAIPTTKAPDTVKTADTTLGKILVDAEGMTLYYFANDIPASGASTCYGQCAVAWPIFSDTVTVSSPLLASDFSSITRTDGTKQTTYRGWPLYYWQGGIKHPGVWGGER